MLDPISEMLTTIRNAQLARHNSLVISSSKLKLAIAKILVAKNFVASVQETTLNDRPHLEIGLLYHQINRTQKDPAIREIKRVSKQGQRAYIKKTDIKKVKNGVGVAIISTSRGVMTGEDAHKKGLGGEYICEVW